MRFRQRYAARVDENQSAVVDALRTAGAQVYIAGHPLDLLVQHRGETFLMEVKRKDGTLTDDQEDFLGWWLGRVVIVTGVDEALSALGNAHAKA